MVLSLVYAASAYPAGLAARRWSRRTLLGWGMAVLIVADLVLATAATVTAVLVGAALWGLHMGLTQGLLAALVADAVAAERAGTAFGFFNLVTGVFLLLASTLAGLLWDSLGAAATFSPAPVQRGGAGRAAALSPLGRQRLMHCLHVGLTDRHEIHEGALAEVHAVQQELRVGVPLRAIRVRRRAGGAASPRTAVA